jgi:hypothetical protein
VSLLLVRSTWGASCTGNVLAGCCCENSLLSFLSALLVFEFELGFEVSSSM